MGMKSCQFRLFSTGSPIEINKLKMETNIWLKLLVQRPKGALCTQNAELVERITCRRCKHWKDECLTMCRNSRATFQNLSTGAPQADINTQHSLLFLPSSIYSR